MKTKIFIRFFVFVVALFVLTGCGGKGVMAINFNLPITMSGGGYSGSSDGFQPYGYYYPYSSVVVSNHSDYWLWLNRDGAKIRMLPPQSEHRLDIRVLYNNNVRTVLTVNAYKLIADDRYEHVGTYTKTFSFNGRMNEKRIGAWEINNHDFNRY